MFTLIKRHWLTAIACLLGTAVVAGIWYWAWWAGSRPPVNYVAPHFTVVNKDGQSTDFFKLSGKVRVVYFFKSDPSSIEDMINLQEKLKEKELFGNAALLIPVPLNEDITPALVSEYGFKADLSGWWFLSPKENPYTIASRFFLKGVNHSDKILTTDPIIVEVDRNNWVRRVINGHFAGNATDVEEGTHSKENLMRDIEIMAQE
ncbi:hypothetical protein [Effusibacillus pohliae]|uniref:hypothetical protein n=1 Tax=Effusibacillus pohliae TaxID=232270 RepID=UPI00037BE447|nr:hypothetical protein [Effusibacillus pohliae]